MAMTPWLPPALNLGSRRRLSGKLAVAAILTSFLARTAVAGEDPFAELREARVDRILIADSRMNPTSGEGVIWIRDPAVIRRLLAPLEPRKGGSFLCGYHHDLKFFSGEHLVRTHRLNTECRDYVVEERSRSFQFEGQLAARWQPYVDRMTTSTGQWDVDVLFPDLVPIAVARAAIRSAGMEFVPFDNDIMDDKPWVTIRLARPEKSGAGRGRRLPDWLKPKNEDEKPGSASSKPDPKLVAKATRLLGKACPAPRCSIADVDENLVSMAHGWETWIQEITVSFSSNAALEAFSSLPSGGPWKIRKTHRKPTEYAVTVIVDERPTDATLEQMHNRIEGASSVRLGDLRLRPNSLP